MRYFYDYFFKVLRFMPLYKKSALSLIIEALADYFEEIKDDIIYVNNQFIVNLTEKENISSYGLSRGIVRSRYDTDETYRIRVINAYAWNLLGGKEHGVNKILSTYGFKGFSVANYRFIDANRWAEFDVVFNNNKIFDDDYKGLYNLVNFYKPARSKIRQIIFPYSVTGNTYHAGVIRIYQNIKQEIL